MSRGLIHIYCGDGKGKTTAAIGLSIRALGAGLPVRFVQFFKNGDSSEITVLRHLSGCTVLHSEEQFGRYSRMSTVRREQAREAYRELFARAVENLESVRVLVLDEIISAYRYGMVDQKNLLHLLREKPDSLEIVLTGRDPAPELLELADYVSEIQKVKHPFDQGILGRKGIEF
jgi:cob(I)alamin adenosyltransferase